MHLETHRGSEATLGPSNITKRKRKRKRKRKSGKHQRRERERERERESERERKEDRGRQRRHTVDWIKTKWLRERRHGEETQDENRGDGGTRRCQGQIHNPETDRGQRREERSREGMKETD